MKVLHPFLGFLLLLLFSCNGNKKLPVYGRDAQLNGSNQGADTSYTIPDFQFVNQDSQIVNLQTIGGKIAVVEFFFTSCPSICPKMQAQMLRVYEKYEKSNNVVTLAFTIDPQRDSVQKLRAYADKLGVKGSNWQFLTGTKDSIYSTADNFLVSAAEDPEAPGGHVHSGNFILMDKNHQLRGYYDGTKEESVTKLLEDMDILLNEKP